MVKLTIYIEGSPGILSDSADALTVDNSSAFREAFHRLFSNGLPNDLFDLAVRPFGSVTQAKQHLKNITENNLDSVIILDLDGEKEAREARIQDNYSEWDTSKLFFMIQEMEAWILSQINVVKDYAETIGLILKVSNRDIEDNLLLRVEHPELLHKPSQKLDTLLSQHYYEQRYRKGKLKNGPKRYSKMKDGPFMIERLDINVLRETFDEVDSLFHYIEKVATGE